MTKNIDLIEHLRANGVRVEVLASGKFSVAREDSALAVEVTSELLDVKAMAHSRDVWIDKLSQAWRGMVREAAKQHCAELCGYDYNWGPEVGRLAKATLKYFDPAEVETKESFDRFRAAKTAYNHCMAEAVGRVNAVRNSFANKRIKDTKMTEREFLKAFDASPAEPPALFWAALNEHYPKNLVKSLKKATGL